MSVARLSIGGNQLLLWDAGNRLCEHLAAAIRRIGDGVRVVATPSVRPAGKWFRGRPENELVCLFVEHKQSQAFIDRVAGDEQYYVIVLPPSWEKAGIPRARECLRQTMHLLANETHFTRYFMMDDDVTGVAIPTRSTRRTKKGNLAVDLTLVEGGLGSAMALMETAMELNGLAMVSASGTRGAKFGGSVVEKLEARGLDVKTVEELSAIIEEQDDSAEFLLTKSKRCEQFVLVDVALLSASGASYIDAKWLLAGDEAWVTMQMYRDQKTAQGLPTTCSAWVSQLLYQGEDFAVCQQLADQLGRDKVRSIKSLFTVGSNEVSAAGTKGVFREFEAKRKKHAKLSVQEFIALLAAQHAVDFPDDANVEDEAEEAEEEAGAVEEPVVGVTIHDEVGAVESTVKALKSFMAKWAIPSGAQGVKTNIGGTAKRTASRWKDELCAYVADHF